MNQTHFLPAQKLKICRKDGDYLLKMDGQRLKLSPPKRALPMSNPDEFVMLSDENGAEIGMLRSLQELDVDSRDCLEAWLEQLYRVILIYKILEVEREPLSGRVRWRVEVEASGDEADVVDEKVVSFRLLRRARPDDDEESLAPTMPRREITFYVTGNEDVQTARYPRVFFLDTDGNRYEIPNYEALDIASRRLADHYL
ncbi:MAG TPA: DUF1854 domain-containing protein [Abditibacterium sp.]|jgi:hypothetical protein